MGARGRPSRAELAVVPFKAAEARRPDPPPELTEAQAEVWTSIVESLPADWVSKANAPLMAGFCRHVTAARQIARLIEVAEASNAFNLGRYGQLLSMQERETRTLSTLATKLRLARSTVDDRRRTPTPPGGPRPWEG